MNERKKMRNGIFIAVMGIVILLGALQLTYMDFVLYFEKEKISTAEFMGILGFIVAVILFYFYLFDVIMRKEVYEVILNGQQYITLVVHFKEFTIDRKSIKKKRMSILGRGKYPNSYKIEVEHEGKIKTFYIPFDLYDKLKL